MNTFPIVDMHCDTLSVSLSALNNGKQPDMRTQETQINFEKMKNSGYLLQNFAVFINRENSLDPLEDALRMIDLFYHQMDLNQDIISPVKTWNDIEKNRKGQKMSALLSLEEGGMCKGDPAFLSILYRLGARMMTLTWNYENELGFPNFDMGEKKNSFYKDTSSHGLKEQGIYFLEEMERLGMIIDVSHLSDAGFYDVLKYTRKPFVASHSNARSISSALRNLTDDMIRRLAHRGGITGINFCKDFLGTPEAQEDYLDQAIRHMKYLINLGGEDFVGFGSDFDGIEPYEDFMDCTIMPKLIARMEKADFSHTQIEKICYKNVLRIYRELL